MYLVWTKNAFYFSFNYTEGGGGMQIVNDKRYVIIENSMLLQDVAVASGKKMWDFQ